MNDLGNVAVGGVVARACGRAITGLYPMRRSDERGTVGAAGFRRDVQVRCRASNITFAQAGAAIGGSTRPFGGDSFDSPAWAHLVMIELSAKHRQYDQLLLPFETPSSEQGKGLGVTFRDSKNLPFHRWYPYVEGFSAAYLRDAFKRFGPVRRVYDPFGGGGTTMLEASALAVESFYSEINPFMRFVAETKVNASIWARANRAEFEQIARVFLEALLSPLFRGRAASTQLDDYHQAFPDRDYFVEQDVRELIAAKQLAHEVASDCPPARDLLLLAISTNTVRSSNMTRRADLRRRRPGEYKTRVVDVPAFIAEKLREMVLDLRGEFGPQVPSTCLSHDARRCGESSGIEIDLALTSPPYLNGTNYIRNTKLELWLLDHIAGEPELRAYRDMVVAGGINDVTMEREPKRFAPVEEVVQALMRTDGDRRIPLLVQLYFSDMYDVFSAVRTTLRAGGYFVLDIGDSRFYGIHVPTDILLIQVATAAGFELADTRQLAKRRSFDKSELRQVELSFRKVDFPMGQ